MKDKFVRISIICVGILSLLILLYAFASYLLPVLAPFLIAFLIASLTVRPARRLAAGIKAPERVIRVVFSVLTTLIFFSAVGLAVWQVSLALLRFLRDAGQGNGIYDALSRILSTDTLLGGGLFPVDLASRLDSAVGELISELVSRLGGLLASLASSLPRLFLFILVTLLSLVYFSLDYDRITAFLRAILPDRVTSVIVRLRDSFTLVIKKYVLSYSLILLITYATLLVGLWLMGVSHAPVIALFIALLDILPVIGVGTVLIPWGIYSLAIGNRLLGIGLLLLFIVNTVIRQTAEPRIVGKSLNLHPLLTLMMIYIGYALFGIVGILLLPVIAVSILSLLKGDNTAEIN